MYIKLETISESPKAWQLPNSTWIPKSVLDAGGLEHPYYKVKDWWLNIQVENVRLEVEDLINYRGRSDKFTAADKLKSEQVLWGLKPMVIKFSDIPEEMRTKYSKYWGELAANIGCHTPDYEPRLWGNDCFEGNPSDYGQN